MTTYTYDYQNSQTRGWVRGEFGSFSQSPTSLDEAQAALEAVAKAWTNDTILRLVEIDANASERVLQLVARGSRGPLPKDK